MIPLLFRLMSGVKAGAGSRRLQIALLFLALLAYSASGFLYFELPSRPTLGWDDAIWWSLVTMTTVGYGDLFPTDLWGRILVGYPTMLLGVGILGYILSLLATAMVETRMMEVRGMKPCLESNHILICNFISLGKTQSLIDQLRKDPLTEHSHIVIVDDRCEELPAELQREGIQFVKGDPSREATLRQAGLNQAQSVIIQSDIANLENADNRNLKIALTIESLNKDVYTVVECLEPTNEIYFQRTGCDSVVCIASLTEQIMVQELLDPGIGTVLSELTSNVHGNQFYMMDIPAGSAKTVEQLDRQARQSGAILIGIRREQTNHLVPPADYPLQTDDKAILIAATRPVLQTTDGA